MNSVVLHSMAEELRKIAHDLTQGERAELPKKDFAVPASKSNTGEKAYPIPDEQHARSALGFAKMHGDSADLEKVRAKVRAKFPDMLKEKDSGFLGDAAGAIKRVALTDVGGPKGFLQPIAEATKNVGKQVVKAAPTTTRRTAGGAYDVSRMAQQMGL